MMLQCRARRKILRGRHGLSHTSRGSKLELALEIRSRSNELDHCFDVSRLEVDFFQRRPVAFWAERRRAQPLRSLFMMAGVADRRNFALNFTPFQFHGL